MDFCKSTCSWVEIGHYWDMGNRLCYNQRSSHKNVPTRSEYLNQRKLTIHCCDVIFFKNEISDLKWTETTNNLAASSIDGWIKVFIAQCYPLYLYLIYWPANEWRKQFMFLLFLRCRFGQWTVTNPSTVYRSIYLVCVWLGIQNKPTLIASQRSLGKVVIY